MTRPVYLDCNATTPLETEVRNAMLHFWTEEYGNEGSRTHEYGAKAKKAVQKARDQVASLLKCQRDEVIFTSGATESNNIALLGLEEYGLQTRKKHIISSMIEHKAVLEPLELLARRGFEITLLPPCEVGWIPVEKVKSALRPDTLLVSLMHANNETGVLQPIQEVAELLERHEAFFHVDAAQTFGKIIEDLQNQRIDLISVSGHKIFGPKGIGALAMRRRGFERVPLSPIMVGGGQERGLRPGTLPVPLIVGFGIASELASLHHVRRAEQNYKFRKALLEALEPLSPQLNGDQSRILPHCLSLSFPGIDSETLMVALKDIAAVSNGSACTSSNYEPSYVLKAMHLSEDCAMNTIRISWCHMTPEVDWENLVNRIAKLF